MNSLLISKHAIGVIWVKVTFLLNKFMHKRNPMIAFAPLVRNNQGLLPCTCFTNQNVQQCTRKYVNKFCSVVLVKCLFGTSLYGVLFPQIYRAKKNHTTLGNFTHHMVVYRYTISRLVIKAWILKGANGIKE